MTPETNKRSNKIYARIVTFFLILTVVAIFLVLHFTLAKATIKINSSEEDRSSTVLVELFAENSGQPVPLAPEYITGKILSTELDVSISQAVPATTVAGTKAAGYVTIYNNYSKSQTLVATTRLLTADNKLFRISESVNVPAGDKVQVWAEADQPGDEFLIGPSRFTIPGLWEGLQDKIYAQSDEPMLKQALPKHLVTTDIINQAKTALQNEAIRQSLEIFNEPLPDNLKISQQNLSIRLGEVVQSPTIGEETQQFDYQQKVTIYGLVFSQEELAKAAEAKFIKTLPSHETLISINTSPLTYQIMEMDVDKGQAILNITVQARVSVNKGSFDIDKEKLAGLSKEQALEYLTDELKIEGARVELSPFWVKKIPKLKDHIIIE